MVTSQKGSALRVSRTIRILASLLFNKRRPVTDVRAKTSRSGPGTGNHLNNVLLCRRWVHCFVTCVIFLRTWTSLFVVIPDTFVLNTSAALKETSAFCLTNHETGQVKSRSLFEVTSGHHQFRKCAKRTTHTKFPFTPFCVASDHADGTVTVTLFPIYVSRFLLRKWCLWQKKHEQARVIWMKCNSSRTAWVIAEKSVFKLTKSMTNIKYHFVACNHLFLHTKHNFTKRLQWFHWTERTFLRKVKRFPPQTSLQVSFCVALVQFANWGNTNRFFCNYGRNLYRNVRKKRTKLNNQGTLIAEVTTLVFDSPPNNKDQKFETSGHRSNFSVQVIIW